MSLLLRIFVFTALLLNASRNDFESLENYFNIINDEHACRRFNHILEDGEIASKGIETWRKLVWDEVTTNSIFKDMIRNTKLRERLDYLKEKFLIPITANYKVRGINEGNLSEPEKKFIDNLIHITKDMYETYNSCNKDLSDNDISFEENFKKIINNNICFKQAGNEIPFVILKKCGGKKNFYKTCFDNSGAEAFSKAVIDNQNEVLNANCTNEIYEFKDVYMPNMTELCNSKNITDPKTTETIAKYFKDWNITEICDSENTSSGLTSNQIHMLWMVLIPAAFLFGFIIYNCFRPNPKKCSNLDDYLNH
ncbi:putative SP-containing protein [Vairimorpha necatrix]|uniref:SP-containing protein n=1 Tax=Vairimorpha necatrix TaxID=6039 RepID=A0AAX4J8W5_9MICR